MAGAKGAWKLFNDQLLKRKEARFGVSSVGKVLGVQAWGPELGSIKHIGFIWSLLLCSHFLMYVRSLPFVCVLYIMCTPRVEVQESTWYPIEWEIKTVVSLQVGLGIKPWCSERAAGVLNHWDIFPSLTNQKQKQNLNTMVSIWNPSSPTVRWEGGNHLKVAGRWFWSSHCSGRNTWETASGGRWEWTSKVLLWPQYVCCAVSASHCVVFFNIWEVQCRRVCVFMMHI